jgi:hypothetical protein
MPSHPSLNGKQVIRVLEKLAFEVIRISEGSHHILRNPDTPQSWLYRSTEAATFHGHLPVDSSAGWAQSGRVL